MTVASWIDIFKRVIEENPHLAPDLAYLGMLAQGKGFGATSITEEVSAASSLLKVDAQLVVDIGGNVGNYAAEVRQKFPQAEIHVFEPAKVNLPKLKNRFEGDRIITIVPNALSDKAGTNTLFSDAPGSGLASLTKRRLDHFSLEFELAEEVETIVFEDYWREVLQCRTIDIAKLDVEGHELSVLRGFGNALSVTRVIQFEFGGCNIDTRTFFQDFWYFFSANGFAIYRISPSGVIPVLGYSETEEYFMTTNFIAVNRRL